MNDVAPTNFDHIFLHLNLEWALGHDDKQWIVMKWRGSTKGWRPEAFVATSKVVLRRVLEEAGAELSQEASASLDRLPGTVSRWLADKKQRDAR